MKFTMIVRGDAACCVGVGMITSATAIAEIGGFSRSAEAKGIGRYPGLARKLLVWMWTLVRKDEPDESGGSLEPGVA